MTNAYGAGTDQGAGQDGTGNRDRDGGTVLRTHATAVLVTGSALLAVPLALALHTAACGTLPPVLAPLVPYAPLLWPLAAAVAAGAAYTAVRCARTGRSPAVAPPAAPAPVPPDPAELPAAADHFTGRAVETDTVLRMVRVGHRAIAVTGAPGSGKSALAVRLAHELRPLFPDGRLYADLGGGRGEPPAPSAVLAGLLAALGAPAEERSGTGAALAARFRGRTAGRRILLLLDDAADAAQARALLPAGAHCLTLITSRDTLRDLPEAAPVALGPLTEPDALALLSAVAGPGRTTAETDHARSAVHACGLLPLAVRIAAGGQRSRPTGQIPVLAGRLAAERDRLHHLRMDDLAVRAAFEAAYAALGADDRALLRVLGACPAARVTVRIAAAAAADDPAGARSGLDRLADAQLARPAGPDAYGLHDLVRLLAAERLDHETAPADRRAVLERILTAYTEDASAHGGGAWGAPEQHAVPHLVRTAVREGLHAHAHALALAADPWLAGRPGQSPRVAMWAAVLDAARRSGEQGWTAHAMRGLGSAYAHEGQLDRAVDHLGMAATLQRHAAVRAEHITTRRLLGTVLRGAGRYEEALRELSTALEGCRAANDTVGEAEVLHGLGVLHLDRRRPDEAIDCLERALPVLARHTGDTAGPADVRRHLGTAYAQAGGFVPAERHLRAALALYRRYGLPAGEGWTLCELGRLEERRGSYGEGAELHRAALAAFEAAGLGAGVAAAAEAVGDNLLVQGDQLGADEQYRRAAAVHRLLGDHVREAEVRRKLGS
ncbi:tetratricopeptide repeat protein [Streptomyces sp. WMMC940]|uniref:tetratricopeptide repeat protein n=1 Tax=Streptomyces sp. WMMC940 TaxID=3015153 RepID=UPI0022B65DAB|nr:tetratricopeptide repeat protein [Streptomyces sp. WMMC940]MCZ7460365.1 tetratricopeptide repeat protein [Streptomyces sp. WMMC940]